MKRLAMFLSVALLTACQEEAAPTGNGATAANPAATVAAALTPGRYRQDTTLLAFNDPALPPEMAASAAKAVGTTQSAEQCVTPDMVADPKAIVASSLKEGCSVSRLTWDKGVVDVAFACPPGSEFAGADATIKGSYTANSYVMELEMKDKTGKLAKLKVDAAKVGDCT